MNFFLLFTAIFFLRTAEAHIRDVDFDRHPGAALPLNVELREGDRPVLLDRFFAGKPAVVQLGYLGCEHLCGTTLIGTTNALSRTGLVADRDYVALFISIDPRDEREKAKPRPGWHILTGAHSAALVARAVGFRYAYEEESKEFAHPAGFVVVTPEGLVSRYFPGVSFDGAELRRALLNAGRGSTEAPPSSAFDRLLLVCFHDPVTGRHSGEVLFSLRAGGLAFLAAMGWLAWRRLR